MNLKISWGNTGPKQLFWVRPWKWTAGTWKKTHWKGTSSEPSLHFGFQPLIFEGVTTEAGGSIIVWATGSTLKHGKKTRPFPFPCNKFPFALSHFGRMIKKWSLLNAESLKFSRLACLAEKASKILQGLTTPNFRKFLFKNSICSRNRRGACNHRLLVSLALPAPWSTNKNKGLLRRKYVLLSPRTVCSEQGSIFFFGNQRLCRIFRCIPLYPWVNRVYLLMACYKYYLNGQE